MVLLIFCYVFCYFFFLGGGVFLILSSLLLLLLFLLLLLLLLLFLLLFLVLLHFFDFFLDGRGEESSVELVARGSGWAAAWWNMIKHCPGQRLTTQTAHPLLVVLV